MIGFSGLTLWKAYCGLFPEYQDKNTGLLLLKYIIDNVPVLKDIAMLYYNKLEKNDRDNEYWNKLKNLYYKD